MIQVNKTIYIRHKPNLGGFAKINKVTIAKADNKSYIGPAMTASGGVKRGLEPREEVLYLETLLGVSPQSPEWGKATLNYWNNIRALVPATEFGLPLEIGFQYDSKEDRDKGEAIMGYDTDSLIQKQHYGRPINLADYVLFRYCLVYSSVANTIDDIYASPKIRFYIYTPERDARVKYDKLKLKKAANDKYSEILGNRDMVLNVLSVFERFDIDNEQDQDVILDEIMSLEPERFINVCNDGDLILRSLIQKSIRVGLLSKLPNSEIVMYGATEIVGNTIDEAVAQLKTEKRAQLKVQLEAKLKATPIAPISEASTQDFKSLAAATNFKPVSKTADSVSTKQQTLKPVNQ